MPELNAHLFDFGQSGRFVQQDDFECGGDLVLHKAFLHFLLSPALVPDFIDYPSRETAVKRGVLQRLEIGPLALMRCCA